MWDGGQKRKVGRKEGEGMIGKGDRLRLERRRGGEWSRGRGVQDRLMYSAREEREDVFGVVCYQPCERFLFFYLSGVGKGGDERGTGNVVVKVISPFRKRGFYATALASDRRRELCGRLDLCLMLKITIIN